MLYVNSENLTHKQREANYTAQNLVQVQVSLLWPNTNGLGAAAEAPMPSTWGPREQRGVAAPTGTGSSLHKGNNPPPPIQSLW